MIIVGRLARIAAAALCGAVLSAAPFLAAPAAAECFPRATAAVPYRIDYAFAARVEAVTLVHDDEVAAAGEGDGSKWTVVLTVDRYDVGAGPSTLTWHGHTLLHLSCQNDLLGAALTVGQRLFVAGESSGNAPDAVPSPFGRLLVWERRAGAWRFADRLLVPDGEEGPRYPEAARDATTLREILTLLDHMPDTSTADDGGGGGAADRPAGWLVWTLLATAGLWFVRPARRGRSLGPRRRSPRFRPR